MTSPVPDPVQTVTARLTAAPKYRAVHPDTIADVVSRAAQFTDGAADLERQARARLHKVAALHLVTVGPAGLRRRAALPADGDPSQPDGTSHPDGTSQADPASPADPASAEATRAWCRRVLAAHVSTAERLPDLDRFYPALLSLVPPPAEIMDLACALNVFTLPWLRDSTGARYTGYDLNATFAAIGNEFLARHYPGCRVVHADVLTASPPATDGVALLLKTYHCMEGRQPGAGLRLVDTLEARHVVVSFPTRAMNGRAATFARRHIADLTQLAGERGWRLSQTSLPSEDLLAISKA